MAIKTCEFFASGLNTIFANGMQSGNTIAAAAAFDGAYGFQSASSANTAYQFLNIYALAQGWHHFKFRSNAASLTVGNDIIRWMNGAVVLGSLRINGNGKIDIYVNNVLQSVTGQSKVLSVGNWYDFQFRVNIASSGNIDVKIDDVADSTFSGNTKPGSETTVDRVAMGGSGSGVTWHYDNYLLDDAGYKGIIRVETSVSTADGDDNDYTCSTGTDRYAMVDEQPADDDTTYIKDATNNHQQGLKYPATAVLGDIVALAFEVRSKKITLGTQWQGVKEGGTLTYEGAARNLPVTYGPLWSIWEQNPRTTAAWQLSQLNGDANAAQLYLKTAGL